MAQRGVSGAEAARDPVQLATLGGQLVVQLQKGAGSGGVNDLPDGKRHFAHPAGLHAQVGQEPADACTAVTIVFAQLNEEVLPHS